MRYSPAVEALYCEKCGKKLENTFVFYKYELETGEKLFIAKSVCLDKKWYNLHSSFTRKIIVDNEECLELFRIKEK
jgi:hypothetical protein